MAPASAGNGSMSDRASAPHRLPPAAVDITAYREAVSSATAPLSAVRIGLIGFPIAAVALAAALVWMGAETGWSAGPLPTVAVGLAGVAVLLALFVVLPAQLAARRRRGLLAEVEQQTAAAADTVRARLESMGYRVPPDTVIAWLRSPEPAATVPLVHDSVIAARWWRPADGDDRVFLEPYLLVAGKSSALPPR